MATIIRLLRKHFLKPTHRASVTQKICAQFPHLPPQIIALAVEKTLARESAAKQKPSRQ